MNCFFIVKLVTGNHLFFDYNCNFVDYSDPLLCCFKDVNKKDGTESVLGMVPYEKILYVEKVAF